MYWKIGEYISEKVKNSGWGKSIVAEFADFIQSERPDIKGFSASNIWRIKQFYETYQNSEKLAPLIQLAILAVAAGCMYLAPSLCKITLRCTAMEFLEVAVEYTWLLTVSSVLLQEQSTAMYQVIIRKLEFR